MVLDFALYLFVFDAKDAKALTKFRKELNPLGKKLFYLSQTQIIEKEKENPSPFL